MYYSDMYYLCIVTHENIRTLMIELLYKYTYIAYCCIHFIGTKNDYYGKI